MRKFILNLSLFLLILSVLNFGLYLAFKALYLDDYIKHPDGFNSVLLADSHGLTLGDKIEEFGIFNFSEGSESYVDMKRKLNYSIRHHRIDTVFVQVEAQLLSNFREGSNNNDRSIYYSTPSDFNNFYTYAKERYLKYYFVMLNSKSQSLFRYYLRSKFNSLLHSKKSTDNDSWESLSKSERNSRAIERGNQFFNAGLSERSATVFQEILSLCEENDIELIGIEFPISDELLLFINDPANKTIFSNVQKANSIFQTFNINVIEFEENFKNNPHLFSDEDHLNEIGAMKFVSYFKETVKQ